MDQLDRDVIEGLANIRAGIPKARDQVELCAKLFNNLPRLPDWRVHQPFVEFVYYLSRLDYEIKVLLVTFIEDRGNRLVWEPYLALLLREAIETLPRSASITYRSIKENDGRSGIPLERFRSAQSSYRGAIKEIKQDKPFMEGLNTIRNGVAAHHGFDKGKGAEIGIEWTLITLDRQEGGDSVLESSIADNAIKLGSAIQEFAMRLAPREP